VIETNKREEVQNKAVKKNGHKKTAKNLK